MVTPTKDEIRELALKLFYETEGKGFEHVSTPEDNELKESGFWIEAQQKLMSSENTEAKEELYQALDAYQGEVDNIIKTLKEIGESPKGYEKPEELEKEITRLENKLSSTEDKLETTNKKLEDLANEKTGLDEAIRKQQEVARTEPRTAPEFGALKRREEIEEAEEEEEEAEKGEEMKEEKKGVEKDESKKKKAKSTKPPKKGKAKKLVAEPTEIKKLKGPNPHRVATQPRVHVDSGVPVFEVSTNALVKMYEMNLNVLNQAIHCGAVNIQLGTLALMIYADLLHGGAYAAPVNMRPFTAPNPNSSPYYAGELKNVHPTEGLMGWLISVLGLTHATDIPTEIMVNSNVPHVFPKLLSDEAYQAFMYLFAYTATTEVFKSVGSGVSTYVESAARLIEASTQGAKTSAEAAKTAMPSNEEVQNLMALFKLLAPVAAVA